MAGHPDLEHRQLRSAIEYAVVMADEAAKRRADLGAPPELRKHAGGARIPSSALGGLRRAIEGAPRFREAIAPGAVPELVDPIGVLWLQRPAGWEAQVAELDDAERQQRDDADIRRSLQREEKRRRAAEQAAARTQVDVADARARIDRLRRELDDVRADVVKAQDEAAELRAEVVDARNEARHARDREAAAVARLEALAAESGPGATGSRRSAGVDGRADEAAELGAEVADDADLDAARRLTVEPAAIAEVAAAARELAGRLDALLPDDAAEVARPPAVRQPLRLPGGVIASSAEAAEALLRADATVLLDGYNVAKLSWPNRSLEEQRTLLLDRVENLARRFGADVTVVFDGAAVVGAHAPRRRLVRVVFSSEGVLADDVIRDEVRRLPVSRPVVVVTNDAEIVRDVKADGANVVPSNALLALL